MAPSDVVKKLEREHLVRRSGHMYEPQEWGKVVRRWPIFSLTEEGQKIAKEIVDKLYGPAGEVTEIHASSDHSTIKTATQLDAEIAEALSAYGQHAHNPQSKLRPVEGLQIPPASRSELNRFWRAHPALRKGCLRKYGFDPIDKEEAYWRYGLAEPDHLSLLRAVQRNNDIFSLALVKRWEVEELKHANESARRS